MRSGGAIPPPHKRGILAILARHHMKTRQKGCDTPSAILSRKGIARYGRVSRTGPLRVRVTCTMVRKTQEGCGGLRGENPGAFAKAGPIFQQPFSLLEIAQTLEGIALRAAGKSMKNFPAASKFAGKPFQQGISDSHSLLEFSDKRGRREGDGKKKSHDNLRQISTGSSITDYKSLSDKECPSHMQRRSPAPSCGAPSPVPCSGQHGRPARSALPKSARPIWEPDSPGELQ